MTLELKLNGHLVFAMDGYTTADQRESDPLYVALAAARDAIKKHREAIHGPDYDYASDETYQPEAALYSVLPQLEAALKGVKQAENEQKVG